MKKNCFALLLFILFFMTNLCNSYSSVKVYSLLEDMQIMGDDWNEIELFILTGGDSDKPRSKAMSVMSIARSTASLSTSQEKSVQLYQNASSLKAKIALQENVVVKVVKAGTNISVYMRQHILGSSSDLLIDTSRWLNGYYDVVFTNLKGETIAKATVYVY